MKSDDPDLARHLLTPPKLFDRLTLQTRQALALAQRAALQAGSADISTEHLLLGLVLRGKGLAAQALASVGLDTVQLGVELLTLGRLTAAPTRKPMRPQLTDESKAIIGEAVAEAGRRSSPEIGTEHLLLGLLAHPDCAACQFLVARGFTLAAIRSRLEELLGAAPSTDGTETPVAPIAPATTGLKSNVVTCRLDDRTLDAVDSLVEAGIRSSRSDAVAWLVATGIEAHQDLFGRIAATVASIRQLRAEAADIAWPAEPRE